MDAARAQAGGSEGQTRPPSRWSWRDTPAGQRLAALSPAITGVLHVLGAMTVVSFSLARPGSSLVEATPGGVATFFAATVLGGLVLVWEAVSSLRVPPPKTAPPRPSGDQTAVVRVFRILGLLGFVRWTSAPVEQWVNDAAPSTEPTVFGAIVLVVFGVLAAITGLGMFIAGTGPQATFPIVDANLRPIEARTPRALQRGSRMGFGVLMIVLGVACVVDVVLAPGAGELGLSHAIGRVAEQSFGGAVMGFSAAILLLCAVAAAVRAVVTWRSASRR